MNIQTVMQRFSSVRSLGGRYSKKCATQIYKAKLYGDAMFVSL